MRLLTASTCLTLLAVAAHADPLPSWNDTEAKAAIIEFVETVTDPSSEDFVPQADRIATFDNDGCLWAEQPVYFQLLYAIDVLREKAASDPSILTSDALKAGAEGNLEGILAGGMGGLLEVVNGSHSGVSVEDFQSSAGAWLESATHPSTGMPYGEMIYQPMLELLSYLRDEGFATYIVSGGGIDFIRAFAEDTYGIPPWQVVGTEGDTTYAADGGVPTLTKNGGITFLDDKEGKPVGIMRHIGQRPIFAAGNSDGDFQMLEYTTAGDGARFGMLVHHTDADREFAYDRDSHVGQLARGLDEGEDRGWLIVDMAQDWSKVWPGE
ncbi:HAD family hydrolase [Celeribacter sp.]|uniref:HAD family hydrolase n=1 Tax=Celeribacter sp. TaxID=1890673 RepID=UPI003A8EEF91